MQAFEKTTVTDVLDIVSSYLASVISYCYFSAKIMNVQLLT